MEQLLRNIELSGLGTSFHRGIYNDVKNNNVKNIQFNDFKFGVELLLEPI